MKAFKRLFKYIWPQWPRIIVVVLSAVVVAALLSLSFMTIIPLLKVMMGSEGLHGWVDRKTCEYHYGLEFYVPKTTDFSTAGNHALAYRLLATGVEKNSLAEAAGLKPGDSVAGIDTLEASDYPQGIPFAKLLEELASAGQTELGVLVERPDADGTPQTRTLTLSTSHDEPSVKALELSRVGRLRRELRISLIDRARWAVSFLPREMTKENKIRAVLFIVLVIGIVTVIRCLARFYQSYLAQKIMQVGINHLREDIFSHLMDMPMGSFANARPSDGVSRIVHDTAVMGQAIKVLLGKALREPLNALFMITCAMLLNWQLTLVFLCSAPLVVASLAAFGKKMKRATKRSLVARSQMLAKLQGTMAGLKIVKVYNQQLHEQAKFKEINKRLLRQLLKISKVDAATNPVLEVFGMAAAAAALVVGAHWVTQGRIDSPEFLTLLILLGVSADAVRKISDIWNRIQGANAAAERAFAVLDQPVESDKRGVIELHPLQNEIAFENVTFTYPGSKSPVLRGINLTVRAGHNVALVGPNGSGKTTLANLIPRFYDPDTGRILIDGNDIRDATLVSLRRQIAMVTQDVVTFNDTIAANISYGKPGATREECVAAARRAFAHEFITPLADGYDTIIGEQGAGLSGGQLQRIVIARAILNDPSILIFDEATSQVDADSEAKIHKAIAEVMDGRTTFIIAHRFSTVITADVIIVIDKGQIIAQGQHNDLIEKCQLYQSLYENQLVGA
ncbi:MAG: ATP-binding cassette domain-containing protein [Phycisphaerales bacterium]|nr:MAG: ATP-binding cassette domain-containing protein [Phycisphaerales bacterium]